MKNEGLWPTMQGIAVLTSALIRCKHEAEAEGEHMEAMHFHLLVCLLAYDAKFESVFRHLLDKAEYLAGRCPAQQDGAGISDSTGVRILLEACDLAFTDVSPITPLAAVKCAMALLPDEGKMRLVRNMLI